MPPSPTPPHFLTLPYDIRYLIYTHLFPPGKQLYLQAFPNKDLRSITGEHSIPTPILRTNRLLHAEASEYLYNTYLFNIVGRKIDCLALYGGFLAVLERYAKTGEEVHVDVFTNGGFSKTMCVSLHAGEGKRAVLRRRERGVAKSIEQVWEEVRSEGRRVVRQPGVGEFLVEGVRDFGWVFAPGVVAVLVVVVAWVVVGGGRGG